MIRRLSNEVSLYVSSDRRRHPVPKGLRKPSVIREVRLPDEGALLFPSQLLRQLQIIMFFQPPIRTIFK